MGSAEMGIATVPSEARAASELLAAGLSAWLPEDGAPELWDGALLDVLLGELHPAADASIAAHITRDRVFFIELFIAFCFPPQYFVEWRRKHFQCVDRSAGDALFFHTFCQTSICCLCVKWVFCIIFY